MSKRLLFLMLFTFSLLFATKSFSQEQTIFIFLGPPGAGKGVLCKKLSQESQVPHISTGDLLREEQANKNSPLSIELAEYVKEGQLVPDDMIVRILMHRINKPDCKNGFILDGFPRTLNQAQILDKALPSESHLVIVNLKVEDSILIERLLGRRTCSSCTQPFHIDFSPPKKEGICDLCKHNLVTRNDDCEVAIQNRLEIFKEQFGPIREYYQEKHHWVDIDAKGDISDNYSALLDQVKAISLDQLVIDSSN